MASGLNNERPTLKRRLTPPAVGMLVVDHRGDRLTRVDYASMAMLLAHQGRRVETCSPGETGDRDDVVEDVVAVLTSMAARISGRHISKRRAERSRACVGHVVQSEDA
jgi:predicted site-specific integrase-resolvase